VDLRLIPGAEPNAEEKDAIARALPQGETEPVNGSLRHHLLPALLAVQRRMGWISPGALNDICLRLDVPPAEAYGVATFYDLLSTEPLPKAVVRVCDDIACRVNGAEAVCEGLERALGPEGKPGARPGPAWFRSPCLGHCERGPAALFEIAGDPGLERTLAPVGAQEILEGLAGRFSAPVRHPTGTLENTPSRLLRRVGAVDPESLESYRAHGGYEALARAIEMGAEQVRREVQASRLMGRGGAAFPTGRKWEAVAKAPAQPHYLVCNADESEPGTFKDRVLMEEDPFAVIEAMTIGALATGSERGYIYVRGEYPLAAARLSLAIERAHAAGLLGADIMKSGHSFYVEVRRGAGAYICGEETALFNSIEGKRGEPRNKPPFPVEVGLFGKPTAINNVETFVNVLEIVQRGGAAFATIGTADSTGTRLFCLSGCVARPGLYEAPFGASLGELIETAGGVREGRSLQAVLLGGAAGTFVTAADLDMPLSFEGTRAAGASLGSGVIMVFDDTIDMTDIVLRIAAFFRHESCGQCVPCREGTHRQEETLLRIANGAGTARADGGEIPLLADIAGAMKDASICGLGQTAAFAVQSAITKLGLFAGGRPGIERGNG
jgi:NADH-quinone oxidoreductase subunit F